MSLDLVIWTACTISLPQDLPHSHLWKNYGDSHWAYEQESWQILVDNEFFGLPPNAVHSVNKDYVKSLSITIEPIHAGKEAHSLLDSITSSVAIKCGGAIIDGTAEPIVIDSEGKEQ